MSTIQTSIQLIDRLSSPLTHIIGALNMGVTAFQNLDRASDVMDSISCSGFQEEMQKASIAAATFQEQLENVQNTAQKPIEPTWNIQSNVEVFDSSGIERLTSEMNSLDDIINEVSNSQQRIGEQALSMDILPPNASWDINATNQRMDELVQKLNNFQSQDISFIGADGIDRINGEYESLRQSMNSVVNIQEQMNQAMENGDVSKLNAGYTQLNNIAEQMEQRIRDNIAAIQQMNNVQWSSPQNIEIFQGNGVERYKQEIQSANDLMNRLAASQQAISQQAANTTLFPANMVNDINGMNNRIDKIRQTIQRIEANPLNGIGADSVNREVEQLRQHLNQALDEQQSLNDAMQQMDIAAANQAYSRLNGIIDSTERNIRDNVDAQGQFNQTLQNGQTAANGLQDKIMRIAAAYLSIQGTKQVVGLSDTMAQTEARLSLIVDDGGSVDALQDKIFLSAQRARGDYLETANAVAQLGLMAGRAFANNDEIIAFTEQMNKNFVIGNQDIQTQAAAMRQLTQAMAAGRLQGDEFVSVMEGAPLLAQSIADYMGMPIEKVKELSSEGLITADVVKGAMFSSIDEVNARFEQMPKTFADATDNIKNNAVMAFEPILKRLNEVANSPQFQLMAQNVIGVLVFASGVAMELFDIIGATAGFISDNWSVIAPWIMAAATALSIYTGFMIAYNTIQTISNGIAAISAARSALKAGLTLAEAAATTTATGAQVGLNAALLACPITWIILAVIALIAIFYAVVAAVNKFAGTSVSATGIIFGAFAWLGSVVANIFMAMLELVFGVVNLMVNPFIRFANFIGNFLKDPVSAIVYLFQGMADSVLGILEKIASALDFIFGSNMADTVAGWRSGLKGMADALVESRGYNPDDFNAISELDLSVEKTLGWNRLDNTDAYNAGYKAGENLENFDFASLFPNNIPDQNDYTNTIDPSAMAGHIANIDANTGSMSDTLSVSEEDLKYLRDIAERETINRFTTAEVSVNFGGVTNNVNKDMDLDGIVDYIAEGTREALEISAAGVYL